MTAVLLIATAVLLIALAIWDIRRTFRRIDEAYPRMVEPPVDPVDLGAEIYAYRVARDFEDAKGRRAVR
jgi:hypothetical protein